VSRSTALLAWLESQPKPATQPAMPRDLSPTPSGAAAGRIPTGAESAGLSVEVGRAFDTETGKPVPAAHAFPNSETPGPNT
jgi:hypothetical protein